MNNTLPVVPQGAPAYLQQFSAIADLLADINQAAVSGLDFTGGHPRISVKGSRFRLQQPSQDEMVLNTLELYGVIVGVNPHMSKTYYAGAYDPGSDSTGPTCYSDNGVGPSVGAQSPQCSTCAACPHNVLGSKVSDAGNKLKACADSKKIALLVADVPGQVEGSTVVYELRMPYMSAKNFIQFSKDLVGRVYLPQVLVKISFSSNTQYPNLQFAAAKILDEATTTRVVSVMTQQRQAIEEAIGKNDMPKAASAALPAPAAPVFAPPPAPPVAEAPKKTRGKSETASAPVDPLAGLGLGGSAPTAPQPAATATVTAPPMTDAVLDNILAGIMPK